MKSQFSQFLTRCACGNKTSRKYAREHGGQCKACAHPESVKAVAFSGDSQDTYHDYIASGAAASGVSFSDC